MRPISFLPIVFAAGLSACSGGDAPAPIVSSAPLAISSGLTDIEIPPIPSDSGDSGDGGYASLSEFMQAPGGGFGPGGVTFDQETGTLTFEQDGETYVFDAGNSGDAGEGGAPDPEGASGSDGAPGFEDPGIGGGGNNGGNGNGNAGWIFFYTDHPNAPDRFEFDDEPGIPGNAQNALKNKP